VPFVGIIKDSLIGRIFIDIPIGVLTTLTYLGDCHL